MHLRWFRLGVTLLVAVAALAAAQGAAAQSEIFHFTDEFVTAGFRSTDPTGCITSTVLVTGGSDVDVEPPGAPTRTSGASLRIQQFNSCTGEFTFCSGFGEDVQFSSNPSVKNASLTGTIPVVCTTPTGTTTSTAEIDLAFACTGEIERDRSDLHFHFEGFVLNAFFRGATCDAVATGTVLLDGVNVTPNPSIRAEIVSETGQEARVEIR